MVKPLRIEFVDAVVENPRLKALVRYWDSKRGSQPMPSRRQLDPIEIPRLLSIVLIADITMTGATVRLLGADTTAAYGKEIRGKRIDELDLGEFLPFWLEAFAVVIRSGNPASAGGPFHKGRELRQAETVLLPLSDNGTSISHVFGGLLIGPMALSSSLEPKAPYAYKALPRHVAEHDTINRKRTR